jgi:hypothetical protein
VHDLQNTAEGLRPNASSPSRQSKATHLAGGPARCKTLSQRHTLGHPQPGADRWNLLTNRSRAALGPKSPDQGHIRRIRRQAHPRCGRRCVRSAMLTVRFVRMRPRDISCFPWHRVKVRVSESENRMVLPEDPQKDAISDRPAAWIRSFSQPDSAVQFEPCRRHFHGQP